MYIASNFEKILLGRYWGVDRWVFTGELIN